MSPITDMANNAGSDSSTKMANLSASSGQGVVQSSKSFLSVERINENGINLVRVTVDPHAPAPNTSDWDRVKSMTEEELQAVIDSDPDCAELPDEAWETAEFVPAFTPIQTLKR